MHVNHSYLLDFVERLPKRINDFNILDYGCGAGEVVIEGRKRGLMLFGTDVFYSGGKGRQEVEAMGFLGTIVREIDGGKIDFPDNFFDVIVNNMVFEHIENIEQTLAEINRVLKPGGTVLSLFPSREVWREGHCGIPFLHWFHKNSKLRHVYALWLRQIGLGFNNSNKSPQDWVADTLQWLDRYCFYRDRQTIIHAFSQFFRIEFIEHDYIRFRLQKSRLKLFYPIVNISLLRPVIRELFCRSGGFLVILALKPLEPSYTETSHQCPFQSCISSPN
jgi:SAM-dependent methyltransferase